MKKHLFIILGGLLSLNLFSQQTVWLPHDSNLDAQWGIRYLSVVDTDNVWGIGYNGNFPGSSSNKFTHSTNGTTFTTGSFISDTNTYNASNISAVSGTTAFISLYNKAALGAAGKIIATTNGGTTWNLISDTTTMFTGSNNYPDAVHFYNSNLGWAWGDPNPNYFEFYRTKNGGANWTRVPPASIPAPLSNEYGLNNSYTVYGSKFIWFGTTIGRIYRSSDSGNTWQASAVPNMDKGTFGIAFRDSLNGLAWGYTTANTFLLMKTTDGGSTWLSTPSNGSKIGRDDICIVPGKSAYMSVGVDSAGSTALTSITYDDANTWNVIETGPATFMTAAIWWMLDAQMIDSIHGWAGSLSTTPSSGTTTIGAGGMNKYNGPVITTVGISTLSDNSQITIFPNPSNGILNVNMKNIGQNTNIYIDDLLGNEVYHTKITSSYNEQAIAIDLSIFSKGVYLFRVNSGQNLHIKKIIIQ